MYFVIASTVELSQESFSCVFLVVANNGATHGRALKRFYDAKTHVSFPTKSFAGGFEVKIAIVNVTRCPETREVSDVFPNLIFAQREKMYSLAPVRIRIEICRIEHAVVIHEITIDIISLDDHRQALGSGFSKVPFNK